MVSAIRAVDPRRVAEIALKLRRESSTSIPDEGIVRLALIRAELELVPINTGQSGEVRAEDVKPTKSALRPNILDGLGLSNDATV